MQNEVLVTGQWCKMMDTYWSNTARFMFALADLVPEVHLWGPGVEGYDAEISLEQVIEKTCKWDRQPIIYSMFHLTFWNIDGFVDETYPGVRVMNMQDMPNNVLYQYKRGVEMERPHAILFETFALDFLKHQRELSTVQRWIRFETCLNPSEFPNKVLPMKDRPFDVVCFGRISENGGYPLRSKLFALLKQESDAGRIKVDWLPGVGRKTNHGNHQSEVTIRGSDLYARLAQSRLCVVTPTLFQWRVQKFAEAMFSRTVMLGDLPKFDEDLRTVRPCMVTASLDMSDEAVCDAIQQALRDPEALDDWSKKAHEFATERLSVEAGKDRFIKIMNHLSKTMSTSLEVDGNCRNQT